jgi:hypothetical protein
LIGTVVGDEGKVVGLKSYVVGDEGELVGSIGTL